MKTLIKTAFASALALGAVTATAPAIAGDNDIIVQSQAAMEEWSQGVTRSLNRQLVAAERFSSTTPKPGIVQIRFTLDDNGNAENFKLYRSSGHNGTDNVAKRAVRKLRKLDEAPVSDVANRTFQANVIFAADRTEHRKLAAKLDKMERSRLARGGPEAEVVTLGG